MSTPKRWADEYSSDEGSVDPDDEPEEKPQPSANASKALAPEKAAHQSSYNVVAPGAASLIAYVTVGVSTTTRSDIGHFFEMKGCSIRNLDFHISHDGRHCTAIIEFKDDESFQICLRANGEPYQGSSIRTKVFEVRDKARGPQGNIQGGRGAPRGGDDRFAGRRNGPPSQDPRADVRGDARGDSRGGGVGGGRGAGYGRTAERVDSSRGPAPYAKDATVVPTAPPSRPKLVLQPRTLPVEIIGKIVADETKPDIFGGGRPHDELLYEKERKKAPAPSTEAPAATEIAPLSESLSGSASALNSSTTVFEFQALAAEATDAATSTLITTAPSDAAVGGDDKASKGEQRPHPHSKGGRGGAGGRGGGGRGDRDTAAAAASAAAGGGKWAKDSAAGPSNSSSSRPPRDAGEGGGGRGGVGAGRGGGGRSAHDASKAPAGADDHGASTSTKPTSLHTARKQGERGSGGGRGPRDRDTSSRGNHPKEGKEGASADHVEGIAAAAGGVGRAGRGHNTGRGEGSSKLFAVAAKQANLSHSKSSKATVSAPQGHGQGQTEVAAAAAASTPAAPALTEEERFQKAQEKFQQQQAGGSFKSSAAAGSAGAAKKANCFAALNNSDSEDE